MEPKSVNIVQLKSELHTKLMEIADMFQKGDTNRKYSIVDGDSIIVNVDEPDANISLGYSPKGLHCSLQGLELDVGFNADGEMIIPQNATIRGLQLGLRKLNALSEKLEAKLFA